MINHSMNLTAILHEIVEDDLAAWERYEHTVTGLDPELLPWSLFNISTSVLRFYEAFVTRLLP